MSLLLAVQVLTLLLPAAARAGETDAPGELLTRRGAAKQAAAGVVSGLLKAAAGEDEAAKEAAGQAVLRLGPQDADLAPHFAAALSSGSRGAAAELALQALSRLGSADQAVLRAIAARAGDKEPAVRAACARALSAGGHDAGLAVGVLSRMIADQEPSVRGEAALALGRLGSGAKPALQAMVNLLVDKDPGVKRAAAMGLGRTREAAVVNALAQYASGCREEADLEAAFRAFLEMGETAAPARNVLHRLVYDRHEQWGAVDVTGLAALARMTGQYDPYGKDLAGLLGRAELKLAAAHALGRTPQAAAGARDALLAGLKDPDLAAACAVALGRAGAASRVAGKATAAGPVGAALIGLLDSDDPALSAAALRALGDIGDMATAPEVTRRADAFGDVAEVWLQYALCRLKQEPDLAMRRLQAMATDPWKHRALAGAVLRYLESGARAEEEVEDLF